MRAAIVFIRCNLLSVNALLSWILYATAATTMRATTPPIAAPTVIDREFAAAVAAAWFRAIKLRLGVVVDVGVPVVDEVGVGVSERLTDGVCVGVTLDVGVCDGVTDAVEPKERDGVGVGVVVGVDVTEVDAVDPNESEGVPVFEGVGVGVDVGLTEGAADRPNPGAARV